MKYIRGYRVFETLETLGSLTPEQTKWLDRCTKGTWHYNPESEMVSLVGNFDCADEGLSDFMGVSFFKVTGSFYCQHNTLTSLKGAPQRVGVDFYCSYNSLTSIEGSPQLVGRDFRCLGNELISLKGAPREVGGDFYCNEFETREWNLKGWMKILKKGGEAAALIMTILPDAELDKWMIKNPLDMDLLDRVPEIKKGVIQRTGIRDTSAVARQIRGGTL